MGHFPTFPHLFPPYSLHRPMKNNLLFTGVILLLLIFSCKSSQNSQEKDNQDLLIFGSMGGFTGQKLEYSLNRKGDLFLYNSLKNETTEVGHWTQKDTKALFKEAGELNIAGTHFNEPGNMSSYVGTSIEGKRNEVKWGAAEKKPPAGILAFYKKLNEKAKAE